MASMNDGIIRRGNTWSYVIRVVDPETGLSKPRWVGGFATEDEAKEARDNARVAARRGQYVDRSSITVREYLTRWLDTHALEIKPRTLAGYRWQLRAYVYPRIGHLRLQAVRPSTLSALYRELLASGGKNGRPLSSRSVNYVHAVLRKAFNDAVHADQLLATNPAERAKKPRAQRRRITDVWTAAQLRQFLDLMKEHRWFAFYRLAAYTGARRGELLNLRWADVDWKAPAIRIRGSVGMAEGERIEGTTKNEHERTVSLDTGTVEALRAHRRAQMRDQAIAGDAWNDTGLVFVNGLGEPIYPDSVSQRMAKAIRSHNERVSDTAETSEADADSPGPALPHARLHDLRHVHATLLLTSGVPVHVVAERLGHADPAITLRVYAHVIRQSAAGVADLFAATVDNAEDEAQDDDPAGQA